jgi:RNA recognition motif-containing protein
MSCLFVGNLTKSVTESKLNTVFKTYGRCRIEIKLNKLSERKGPYAFIEYDESDNAQRALKDLNKTNLRGINGQALARIEYSYKRRVNDKLESNEVALEDDDDLNFSDDSEDRKKKRIKSEILTEDDIKRKNICFICKLPGHIAKDCVLTKESCYECGEKGHIAKECNKQVREAKYLTENRVKAIHSQQSAYKYITTGMKLKNVINHLKSKN